MNKRLRWKILVWVGGVLTTGLATSAIFLFLLPLRPTGFPEIKKRWEEDVRQATEKRLGDGKKDGETQKNPGNESRSPRPVERASNGNSVESSEETFLRCIRALAVPDSVRALECEKIVTQMAWTWFWKNSPQAAVDLSKTEYDAMAVLPIGSVEFDEAAAKIMRPSIPEILEKHDQGCIDKKRYTTLLEIPPVPEAVELLLLPEEAIPSTPVKAFDINNLESDDVESVIAHAFIHLHEKNPSFDPIAGYRNLYKIQTFLKWSNCLKDWKRSSLMWRTALLLTRFSNMDGIVLIRLSNEIMDQTRETERRRVEMRDLISRYHAMVMYDRLTKVIDGAIEGRGGNNNLFHFFMNGRVENWWLRANRPRIQRMIEQFAAGVASSNHEEMTRRLKAIHRAMAWTNLKGRELGAYSLRPPSDTCADEASMAAVEFAIQAYRLENGVFPEGLHDLIPDYLDSAPEPFESSHELTFNFHWGLDAETQKGPATWIVQQTPSGRAILFMGQLMPFGTLPMPSRNPTPGSFTFNPDDISIKPSRHKLDDQIEQSLNSGRFEIQGWPLE